MILAGCSSCTDDVCPMPEAEEVVEMETETVLASKITEADVPDANISRYPLPTLEEIPEDIKGTLLSIKKRAGFVPNVAYAMAHRPETFRAFMGYSGALSREGSNITSAEKEMIIVAFSAENGCQYCVQFHGASLRGITGDPYISDQIAINYHEADINDRERAIIEFALKVSNNSKAVSEADFENLHKHGLNDEDIFDIANITAFFNLSNRMMNVMAVRPDEEFYTMGR